MIRRREAIEAVERATLAPYATLGTEGGRRDHPEPEDEYRTAFQRDRDRIVHSAAFRSLQHKTQVFVVHEGELYRTRLTHTLEVAQIARSLASYLGANADLAEAVALAHDLGHAPFGHAGEEELSEALEALGVPPFDHNLQSLRIVTELERRDPAFPGLNLSFATREGIARHETAYDRPAALAVYLVSPGPAIEAQIANIADPLAYTTHDLEDALRLRFFEEADLEELGLPLVSGAVAEASAAAAALPRPERARVRHHVIHRRLIGALIGDVLAETERQLARLGRNPDAAAVRGSREPVVAFSGEILDQVERLRRFLHARVYRSPVVLNMCSKGRRILRALFDHYLARPDHLPRTIQGRWPGGPPEAAPARAAVVADYLASLTDRGAMEGYQMLFEPYERTLTAVDSG